MVYEYSGYLKSIKVESDPAAREAADSVVFTADDICHWNTKGLSSFREWQKIPAHRTRTEQGVELRGQFEDVRRIDCLPPDTPAFWVPLSSIGWKDDRFPIDLDRYPILEITYRCTSENARPACVWSYPGGIYFDGLRPAPYWRTDARRIQHFGSPKRLDALVIRLYTTSRTTESLEIKSIRFRAMTPQEVEACASDEAKLFAEARAPEHPILDEFMPLGVYADAEMARRLAEMLGVSTAEYWDLAMEDMVRHHHNCIAVENAERLTTGEWRDMLSVADRYGVKFLPMYGLSLSDDPRRHNEIVDQLIRPNANSTSIFAWGLSSHIRERDFHHLLAIRRYIQEVDPVHPFVLVSHHPSGYPLLAPFFSAVGIEHFASHSPWELEDIVRTHVPLSQGQQFWVVAPGFVSGTGSPEWSSCPELRLMINSAFANGARGWFSYSFHNAPVWLDGTCQRTLTGPFLTFSDLWQELDHRMDRLSAIAPLILGAKPEPLPTEGYTMTISSEDKSMLPEGVPHSSVFRLLGKGYSLIFITSNDIRGMASVNLTIDPQFVEEYEVYDLSDFLQTRKWKQMPLKRHLEMFPGQARILLIARPDICSYYRDVIAGRLIEDDRLQLSLDMRLAREQTIDVSAVERFLNGPDAGNTLDNLSQMDWARDRLLDLIYENRAISDARSRIIEASAAICACDGALCRLYARGRASQAHDLGLGVVEIAREIARLRLELRASRGTNLVEQSQDLANRALALLNQIRSLVKGSSRHAGSDLHRHGTSL